MDGLEFRSALSEWNHTKGSWKNYILNEYCDSAEEYVEFEYEDISNRIDAVSIFLCFKIMLMFRCIYVTNI